MIPQQWQICLTAVRESRKEDHAVASRCAGRRARRRSPSIRSTVAAIRLIVQLKTGVTFTFIRLLAVSNQPVLQPNPRSAIKCCGLATVSNNGVPASTTQAGRMPSRCRSPQALIPAPTAVFRAILSPRRAAACPLRARSARRCLCGHAPSRTRGSANAA